MSKRILAFLMVLAMLVSVLPISVFATETETEVAPVEETTTSAADSPETEASAPEFTLTLSQLHATAANAAAYGLYLTAAEECTLGSYQFAVTADEGVAYTFNPAAAALSNEGKWVYTYSEETAIAVGATPVLLGTFDISGGDTSNIALTDVEVNAWNTGADVPGTATVVIGESNTYHDAALVWTAWTDAAKLPSEAGNYYLTCDVVTADQTRLLEGEVTLCLNGYTVSVDATAEGTKDRIYNVQDTAILNICDCTAHTDAEGNYVAGKLTGASNCALMIPNLTNEGSEHESATINIHDGIITGNEMAESSAAVISQDNGTVNIYGGKICGNTNTNKGAAVLVGSNGFLNIYGGEISGNTSTNGSAIYIADSEVRIEGGKISGNTALDNGGAIYALRSNLTIVGDVEISGNKAIGTETTNSDGALRLNNGNGGAIYSNATTLIVNGAKVNGNDSGNAAIYLTGETQAFLTDVEMKENIVRASGGMAVAVYGASYCEVYGGTYTGNTSTGYYGGAEAGKTGGNAAAFYVPNTTNTLKVSGPAYIYNNIQGKTDATSSALHRNIYLQKNTDKDEDGDGIEDNNTDAKLTLGQLEDGAAITVTSGINSKDLNDILVYYAWMMDLENWDGSWLFWANNANAQILSNGQELYLAEHSHEGDAEDTVWNLRGDYPTERTSLPASSGHYVLSADVVLSKTVDLAGGQDYTICLNGYTITAPEAGRAFRLSNGSKLTICDCTGEGKIIPGKTKGGVVGIYNDKIKDDAGNVIGDQPVCELNISGVTIDGTGIVNGGQGGAINNEFGGTNVTVDNVTFLNLTSTGNGGAIYMGNAELTITNSKFVGCTATATSSSNGNGGAVYHSGDGNILVMDNVSFDKCTSGGYGSAVGYRGGDNHLGEVYLNDVTVTNCDSQGASNNAALYIYGTAKAENTSELINVTLDNNIASNAAATNGSHIYFTCAKAVCENLVATNGHVTNSSSSWAGGIYMVASANITLKGKCIITDNLYKASLKLPSGIYLQNNGSNVPVLHFEDMSADSVFDLRLHTTVEDPNKYLDVVSGDAAFGFTFDNSTTKDKWVYNATTGLFEIQPHAHANDAEGVEWTAWTSGSQLPNNDDVEGYTVIDETTGEVTSVKSGHYYLTSDVTLDGYRWFDDGKITLCLNGHDIRVNIADGKGVNTSRIYYPQGTANLTICDCTGYTHDGEYHAGALTGAKAGAIFTAGSTATDVSVTLDSIILTGNYNAYNNGASGAAVVLQGNTSMTMNNCYFYDNTTSMTNGDGGAIYVGSGTTLAIDNCKFFDNVASQNAGAIRAYNATTTITNSSFTNNTAAKWAGAIQTGGSSGNTTITNCTFVGNSARQYGAIHNNGGSCTIIDSTITENVATHGAGGGLNVDGGGHATLVDTTVTGNTSHSYGAVFVFSGTSKLTVKGDTVIDDNYLDDGWSESNVYLRTTYKTVTTENADGTTTETTEPNALAVVELVELAETASVGFNVGFDVESSVEYTMLERVVATGDADYTNNVSMDSAEYSLVYNAETNEAIAYNKGATAETAKLIEDENFETADIEATLSVPANSTMYFMGYCTGMIFTLNGENVTVAHNDVTYTAENGQVVINEIVGSMFAPPVFAVTNLSDADASYALVISYPLGNAENPDALVLGKNTATISAGSWGYNYLWTAEENGILTIKMLTEATEAAGWMFYVNNETTWKYGDYLYSDADPVVKSDSVVVSAGDQIRVVVNTYIPMADAPAGTVEINASFMKTSSEDAPFEIYAAEQMTGLTVPANSSAYYAISSMLNGNVLTVVAQEGLTLNLNGTELTAVDGLYQVELTGTPANKLVATNSTDAMIETVAAIEPALGSEQNPIKVNVADQLATVEAAAGSSTYYLINNMLNGNNVVIEAKDGMTVTLNGVELTAKDGKFTGALNGMMGNQLVITAGDAAVSAAASIVAARLDFKGIKTTASIGLEEVIYIRATVAFTNAEGTDDTTDLTKEEILANGRVLFWHGSNMPANWDEAVVGTENMNSGLTDAGEWGGLNEYWGISHGVEAKQYTDKVYFRTYIVVDGEEYYGEVSEYSVQTYAENQLKKAATTSKAKKMHTLLVAMLNYGAAAQAQFKYNTGNLANANIQTFIDGGTLKEANLPAAWNESMMNIRDAVPAEMVGEFTGNGLKRTNRTLNLAGAIFARMVFGLNVTNNYAAKPADGTTVTFYFWSEKDYDKLAAAGTALSKDNATYTKEGVLDYTAKYGYEYLGDTDGIAAKQMRNTIYVACVFAQPDGTEYTSGVEVYNAHVYADSKLAQSTTNTLGKLLQAMVVYGEAAKAYFG